MSSFKNINFFKYYIFLLSDLILLSLAQSTGYLVPPRTKKKKPLKNYIFKKLFNYK